jgi:hypothetical protein
MALAAAGVLVALGSASAGGQVAAPPWDIPVVYEGQDLTVRLTSAHCGLSQFGGSHSGVYEVIGELRNEGSACIKDVCLMGAIISPEGATMADGRGNVMVDVLAPGETSPFSVLFSMVYGSVGQCRLVASWDATNQTPSRVVQFGAVQREGPFDSMYFIGGTVVNADVVPALDVRIVFTCYDASGRVVDLGCVDYICDNSDLRCSYCSASLSRIAPGESSLFKCYFLRNPNAIARISGTIQYTPATSNAATESTP